ncbi:hypothetical protein [Giesbergeria anulus]|uniref:Uncharacterized protein n=1 Tax=Giesbergeria anulus TaxID=180197 RepID=A0A1H9NJ11_9BURK|nr:hypothetical protein [Giesbergeria anulus]SER35964.1 hypothetical protein SAMN02982919_02235 [Giesbergeria anulus]
MTAIKTTVEAGTSLITLDGQQRNFVVVGIPNTKKILCFTGICESPYLTESNEDAERLATLWNFGKGILTQELKGRSLAAERISSEIYRTELQQELANLRTALAKEKEAHTKTKQTLASFQSKAKA